MIISFLKIYLIIVSTDFVFASPLTHADDLYELQQIQIIFRHGQRTPYWIYKNDRYQEKDFWEGIGQLVNIGKESLFEFGKVLRERYFNYLDDIYIQNIRAQSSPIRRCIESSYALLAGMIPPKSKYIWSKSIHPSETVLSSIWQPIAVETVEENRSWKLNPDVVCPAATALETKMETSVPKLKRFLEENHKFIADVGKYSGENFFQGPKRNWLWVGYLYDTEFTQKLYFKNCYALPDWYEKIGNDTVDRLSKFNDMVFTAFGTTPEYLKLRAGTFLKEVVTNLQNGTKINQITPQNKKLFTYGSHDTMIAYILHALGLYKAIPTFGSGIIFELRKSFSGERQIHLFYANVTDNFNIYRMNLNESIRFSSRCPYSYCSVENFAISLSEYLENDIEKHCL